jgi:DNA-binding NarL/FixJ family response regulator
MPGPRVLLADDHPLFLGGIEKLLSGECEIVGSVSDGRALVVEAQRLKPDVVVLDIAMPLLNGLEAGRQLKQLQKDIKLIFVTMNEDSELAAEAFRIGASAYLLKQSAASELLVALREVMRGRSYVTPLITKELFGSFIDAVNRKPAHQLTPRQCEVLQLLAEGRSMKQVAALLNITSRTVAFHKYRMMEQLNIHSNAELIQFAITHHII